MPDRRNTGGGYGRGYGGAQSAADYRQGFGEAWTDGASGADYARSLGGRDESFGGHDRTWMDIRAEENRPLAGPYRGKGPRGWSTPDASLYEAVAERLSEDPLIDARGIEVDVRDGVVTLNGHVTTPSCVRLAEMLVRECPGVAEVRNHLTLAPAP